MIRSFSAFRTYVSCPKKAQYKHVERKRVPMGIAFAAGRLSHKAGEHALRAVIASPTRQLPPIEESLEVIRQHADREAERVDWAREKARRESLIPRAEAYARTYLTEVAPTLNPVAVEHRFSVSVDGLELVGAVDVVEEDEIAGVRRFRDTKTGVMAPPPGGQPADRLQLGLYALAIDDTMEGAEGCVDHVLADRKRGVRHLPILLSQDELAAEAAVARDLTHWVYEAVARGDFPRNPMACVEYGRICEYAHLCIPERASAYEREAAIQGEVRAARALERAEKKAQKDEAKAVKAAEKAAKAAAGGGRRRGRARPAPVTPTVVVPAAPGSAPSAVVVSPQVRTERGSRWLPSAKEIQTP